MDYVIGILLVLILLCGWGLMKAKSWASRLEERLERQERFERMKAS